MAAIRTFFLSSESGAVTVDWTVLSAAAVSMALATVTVIEGGVDGLVSRVDGELRDQQLSDGFVTFLSGHFEAALGSEQVGIDDAEYYFDYANDLLNHEVVAGLELGIEKLENGELTEEDLALFIALGSVAYQRNIGDDDTLNHYFGFDGSDPAYEDYI